MYRTLVLALSLSCLAGLAATAGELPEGAPPSSSAASATMPQAAAAVPPALVVATDGSWLRQLVAQQSVDPTPRGFNPPLGAFQASTCIQQCVKSGEDSICCAYICHPIGENPC